MSREALETLKSATGRTKLQAKLQVLANRDPVVSFLRSGSSPGVAVSVPPELAERPAAARARRAVKRRKRLAETASNVQANVLVQLAAGYAGMKVPHETGRSGSLVSARVTLEELAEIVRTEGVVRVELGQPLAAPSPTVETGDVSPPPLAARRVGGAATHKNGRGVLIGIIDVGGFDFSHPDFLTASGETRWVRIWDQGGTGRPSPVAYGAPGTRDYGSELRQEHLNAALAAASQVGAPAFELEPQSSMTPGSHGTHVASIAAGNRGVCREARIAGVLIDLPEADWERRRTFYDSSRIVHAVEYLIDLARELGSCVSINISLGTNGHAHDTSAPTTRWVDSLLIEPGRSVAVAAGNAGQGEPRYDGDFGFVMGRVHTEGRVAARGLKTDLEWVVIGDGIVDVSENELCVWYSSQDRFGVQIKPPGAGWTEVLEPGEFVENRKLADGSMLSVYNELYNAANGCNAITVFLTPFLTEEVTVGVPAGTWLVRLIGLEVRSGAYHAWIERDDPRPVKELVAGEAWAFPSFFSPLSHVGRSTVSSLACGERLLSVANLDEAGEAVHFTSSQGPTRDGRSKPDICAPGTGIVAANGFAGAAERWIAMTGTSMAAPFVTGAVGLMLAANPDLTSSQVLGILQSTAVPLPSHSFEWRIDAGFGRVDAAAAVAEAKRLAIRKDRT